MVETKMGRTETVVLTEEQTKKVETLAYTLSTEQIADYFGVQRSTFYKIMERQPEVAKAYKKGKSTVIKGIADNLITKARDGDTTAQMFFLKTQANWREHSIRVKAKNYENRSDDMILKDIISSLLDNEANDSEIHLDNKTLNTINNLIKTKNELSELKSLKERLDAIEVK